MTCQKLDEFLKTYTLPRLSHEFMNMILKAQAIKAKIDKWDYIKVKGICKAKKKTQQNKKQNENNQQSVIATYEIENICKPYS